MQTRIFAAACLAGLALVGTAAAEYPDRPITIILPHAPGGGGETGIRTWQPYMEKCLGATIVVVARPGAGAALGIGEAASAKPDGYTIGSLTMPNLVSQAITTQAPFTIDSFDYIGSFIGTRSTISVSKDSPLKSIDDFVALAKKSTMPINVAVAGIGNDDHLVGLRFAEMTGIKANFVPFGDGATARNALLGHQVDVAIMNSTSVAGFSDDIRALAIAADERSESLPDVPTFKESGYDIIGGSDHLIGVVKGAPPEVLAKWRDCVPKVAQDPAFIADAKKRFVPLHVMNAAETEAFVRDQDSILRKIWAESPWIKQ